VTVYLDTSSLVKLYVEEDGADAVTALVTEANLLAISAAGYPECRAGLARRRREGTQRSSDLKAVVARLDADWSRMATISVTDGLARRAGALADRFGLRGFDAIHLASFELLLQRVGDDDVTFSTADGNLARAAKRLG
jgi:predicted nucleic acid-binding protein